MWASGQAEAAGELHLLLLPVATAGRSLSPCTVFLLTCSPPMSRKKTIAMATSAPSRAPNCPLVIIADLQQSVPIGPTPASDRGSSHARSRLNGDVKRAAHGYAPTPHDTKLR